MFYKSYHELVRNPLSRSPNQAVTIHTIKVTDGRREGAAAGGEWQRMGEKKRGRLCFRQNEKTTAYLTLWRLWTQYSWNLLTSLDCVPFEIFATCEDARGEGPS